MERCLIVGLGNPGPRYAGNRHNVGFMIVDALGEHASISVSRAKFKGRYGTGTVEGRSVALLKPETFMNLSGQSVVPAAKFFGVEPASIWVVHDELDLPFGTLRLKIGGGHAGHNGLRSIANLTGTKDFVRLRVGIGRPAHGSVSDYVLADFRGEDKAWLPDLVDRGVDALREALRSGPQRAMNLVNTK